MGRYAARSCPRRTDVHGAPMNPVGPIRWNRTPMQSWPHNRLPMDRTHAGTITDFRANETRSTGDIIAKRDAPSTAVPLIDGAIMTAVRATNLAKTRPSMTDAACYDRRRADGNPHRVPSTARDNSDGMVRQFMSRDSKTAYFNTFTKLVVTYDTRRWPARALRRINCGPGDMERMVFRRRPRRPMNT